MSVKIMLRVFNMEGTATLNFPNFENANAFMSAIRDSQDYHGVYAEVMRPSLGVITVSPKMMEVFRNMYVASEYNKVMVIKEIRALAGCGMLEAKDFCYAHIFR